MGNPELVSALVAAVVPVLVAAGALGWFRHRRRDEIFTGVTPGEFPGIGDRVGRARVPGGEWRGAVAPRFTPPAGMTPGLAGTVIDGKAHAVDVSATLVDLAVRGHLRLVSVPAGEGGEHDWRLERLMSPSADPLLPFEEFLLSAVFAQDRAVTIGQLKSRGFDLTMRQAQIGLYREVVDRGWYTKHPLDRNRRLGLLGVPLLLVGIGAAVTGAVMLSRSSESAWPVLGGGMGLVAAASLLLWGGRGRTPRTAEGTAARIQTLAFEKYLATAEANQIRFEEARDIFSRFLPYAVVFGLAQRWAKVFAEVAARAHAAGLPEATFDLGWIDGIDLVSQVGDSVMSAVELADLVLPSDVADLGDADFLSALGDGLGGVVDSVGDFTAAAGNLLDHAPGCGDGCDGCDGCGGCDF